MRLTAKTMKYLTNVNYTANCKTYLPKQAGRYERVPFESLYQTSNNNKNNNNIIRGSNNSQW